MLRCTRRSACQLCPPRSGSEARRALAGVALIVEGLEGLVHGRNLASGAFQDQRRPGAVPQGAEKNQPLAAIET